MSLLKKLAAAAMAGVMLAVATALPASAASDELMKKELTYVKERITIPAEYSVFESSTHVRYGKTYYDFTWNKEDDYAGYNVTICGKIITRYSAPISSTLWDNYGNYSFAKLTKAELLKKANTAIKGLNPTVSQYLVIDEDSFESPLAWSYARFDIERYKNGVPVSGEYGSITLDKNTGEVASFNMSYTMGAAFTAATKAISQTKAQEAYKNLFEIEPVYQIQEDYLNKTRTATINYIRKTTGKIDALTGKLVTEDSYYSDNDGGDIEETTEGDSADESINPSTGGGGNVVEFTDEELEALKKASNVMTVEEATALVKADKYIGLTDDYVLNYSSCGKNVYDDSFTWGLSFSYSKSNAYYNLHVSIDASKGTILGVDKYWHNDSVRDYTGNFDEKNSDATALTILNAYAPDIMDEYRLVYENITTAYNKPAQIYGKYYVYSRFVNGLRVEGDDITIRTDKNGALKGYSRSYTDITFPDAKIISESAAYKKLFAAQELKLSYDVAITANKAKTALVYTMNYFLLDAKTGELLSTPITSDSGIPYSDIDGTSIEKVATKLYENGVYLEAQDGKLNADAKITENDFINLINCIQKGGNYPFLTSIDYDRNTYTYDFANTIKRCDAVKAMVIALYGDDVASIKGIFTSPFTDVKSTSDYCGYFAIANAKKIVSSTSGKILPNNTITRGQALRMLYNFLSNN